MRVEGRGFDELMRKLERMRQQMRPAMETATKEAVGYVHSQVPAYPEPPADSEYRRTGTLGRSIATEVRSLGNQVVGVIGTATVYAPYVISEVELPDGRGPQGSQHRGRWWTLHKVVREARDQVLRIYREAVSRVVAG